ncbi:SH3 domain-containing protein [Massilia sp. S19_KUP03_FR1]|uniref:SH3 domain-containing protein n=1 Tax=Massilia sp. S19_KUP03_FR1 TaxID=3025503 RepID=UPI002FCD798A
MFSAHIPALWVSAACLAGALILTLILAAFLTPRHWWRRANARALAVLVGGTALFGALFMLAAGVWPRPATPVALTALPQVVVPTRAYRVFDNLNLRVASGTGAARIAVVTKGTVVTTTGRVEGDWCEVTASVNGRSTTGWASSLWLRRGDER